LSQEIVNVEAIDDQLLSLLNASAPQSYDNSQGRPWKSNYHEDESIDRDIENMTIPQAAKQHTAEQSPSPYTSPVKGSKKLSMAGSNLSSPFAGVRKRQPAKRDSYAQSKYIGNYRSSSPSPRSPPTKIQPGDVDDSEGTGKQSRIEESGSASSSPKVEKARYPPLDLGERPWRKELEMTKELEVTPKTEETSDTSKVPTKSNGIDEIDDVTSLMKKESSAWD
jgi:hypothetical protein